MFTDFIRSVRIGKRLALLAGILLAFLAMVGLLGVKALGDADDALHSIYEKNTVPLVTLGSALSQLYEARAQVVGGLGADSSEAADRYFSPMGKTTAELDRLLQAYAASLASDAARTKTQATRASVATYVASGTQVVERARSGDFEAATALMRGESEKRFHAARDQLLSTMVGERDAALASFESKSAANRLVKRGMLGLLGLGLLLGAALSFAIATSISRPLTQAVDIASRVADGDLTQTFTHTSGDEVGQLLHALARMNGSLVATVTAIQDSARNVALGSREIASGNMDLSNRTEMQATELQQTAASMEQLTSTVRQNADNAQLASDLAVNASDVASRGGAVVGEVVTTMKGINDSSRKIAEITAVIDGIAFQTNILALNAAVEAARAGDQGRGFAVVASEVRSLAQRSAAAAREIKQLISASVERVEQGTALVDQAGSTIADVVTANRRVAEVVREICGASAEQSSGVAQVSHAVTQMDQATQQNAALVEEGAAAAESLNTQAQQLVQAVSVFRLRADTGTAVPVSA